MNSKVLGCLLGAATGDAMGAPTELKTTRQIVKEFGGRVEEFVTPPDNVFARGRKAGQVTDAFSIPYLLTEKLIQAEGKANREVGVQALIEWGDTEYFEPFAGMTTRRVTKALKHIETMSEAEYLGSLKNKLFRGHYFALSSNGAANKAYPAGLLHPGDIDAAIEDAVELTMASHDDAYCISGACAVAAAVSEALKEDTSVYQIIQQALYGSKKGEEIARDRKDTKSYPGPSVTKRLEMAIEIALHSGSCEDIVDELRAVIGCGPAIAESLPTALGIFIVNQGNTMKSIYDAVNIGDETSAIASIVGAIAGAYNGVSSITDGYLETIERENNMNLQRQAEEIEKLWKKI